MNTYRVIIRVTIREAYRVQAPNKSSAAEVWADGTLVERCDEMDREVVWVQKIEQ